MATYKSQPEAVFEAAKNLCCRLRGLQRSFQIPDKPLYLAEWEALERALKPQDPEPIEYHPDSEPERKREFFLHPSIADLEC